MIWCTIDSNAHIPSFCKRWSFIWRCFFPVCILKRASTTSIKWLILLFQSYIKIDSGKELETVELNHTPNLVETISRTKLLQSLLQRKIISKLRILLS